MLLLDWLCFTYYTGLSLLCSCSLLLDDYSTQIYSPSFAFTLTFYKGDYPFGHKLAQLGELPVTLPD
jgi:hypothetical protein